MCSGGLLVPDHVPEQAAQLVALVRRQRLEDASSTAAATWRKRSTASRPAGVSTSA